MHEQRIAVGGVEHPGGDGPLQEDLDVDLVVGGVDAGRVVDGVGVDVPAGEGVLDPGPLREPQVAPFGDDPAAQLGRVDPHRVVGAVADVEVRFRRRLHERADAAVPQQVHGRPQHRRDQLVGGERLGVDAEGLAHLGRHGHRLRARGWTPPTG